MNAAVSWAVVAAVSWWRSEERATAATGRESADGSGREDEVTNPSAIRRANTKTNTQAARCVRFGS